MSASMIALRASAYSLHSGGLNELDRKPALARRPATRCGDHGLGSNVQVIPPSMVLKVLFVVVVMEACCASTAKTEAISSVVGEVTLRQCVPASVVRRTVPVRPPIQLTVLVGAEPASKSVTTPVFCNVQFAPASSERWTIPDEASRQITAPSGDETKTGFGVPAD